MSEDTKQGGSEACTKVEAQNGSDSTVVNLRIDEVPSVESSKNGLAKSEHGASRKLHLLALSDQAIVSGANFVTGMVLARGLSLAEFGRYSLVWMAILFGANIQLALITSPMMSVGPLQRRMSDKSYLGSVLAFQLFFALCLTLLLAVVILFLRAVGAWSEPTWTWPVLATTFAYQVQDFTRRISFYRKRLLVAVVGDGISYLGQLAAIGACMRLGILSVPNVLWANALTSILAILFSMGKMPIPIVRIRVVWIALKRNWHSARYLLAATLMQWTSGNFFVLISPFFLGAEAVGAIRACQSIMNMTNIWMQGLENSLPSEASRVLRKAGRHGLNKYIVRALWLLGGGTAAVVVVVNAEPELWLKIIYGPHLKGYGVVLRAYGLISLLSVITMPMRAGLRSLEDTKPIFKGYLMTTAYSLITAPLLGWIFGLRGMLIGIIGINLLLIPYLSISLQRRLSYEQNC